jgi:hypothetical protein
MQNVDAQGMSHYPGAEYISLLKVFDNSEEREASAPLRPPFIVAELRRRPLWGRR